MKKTLMILMTAVAVVSLFIGCKAETGAGTYTVTFYTDGGSTAPESQTRKSGEKVLEPDDPTKGGCEFNCWTKDGEEFDFDTDTVSEDMTLVAKWNYNTYAIGAQGPAGGKIFYIADEVQTSTYVDSSGESVTYTWKYLEAAPSDFSITKDDGTKTEQIDCFGYYMVQDPKYDGTFEYNPHVVTTENSDGNGANAEIGQGRYNTTKIVNAMGDTAYTESENGGNSDETASYAARLCSSCNYGNYSDWFLPSLNELKALYEKKSQIADSWKTDEVSGRPASYWSSSEVNQYNVWTLKFSDGETYNASRNTFNKYMRAVRAF